MTKIENKVSETILEKRDKVCVGDKEYFVAPPSVATIILVSEAVSRLPHTKLNPDNIVEECLSVGKNCRVLGEIAALLILGAKHSSPEKRSEYIKGKRYLWGLVDTRRYKISIVDPKEELTDEILKECSPNELFQIISKILGKMELSDFFGLTTFLAEINLLRPTKVED